MLFSLPSAEFEETTLEEQYGIWSGSATTRLNMYRDALQLAADHPIAGTGAGGFRREFRSKPGGNYLDQHASHDAYITLLHNDHLQYLVELGLVGFLLWTGMLFFLYKLTIGQLMEEGNNSHSKLMALSILLGITAMLIHALFSFPVRVPSTASLFWISIGLLMAYQNQAKTALEVSFNSRTRRLSTLLYMTLLLFSTYLVTNRAVSSYYLQQAENAIFDHGQCNQAKEYLNKAMSASGLDIRIAHITAVTYDVCGHHSPTELDALMDRILEYEPNQAMALTIKGKLAYVRSDYERAAAFFRLALLANPDSKTAAQGFAACQNKLRQTN